MTRVAINPVDSADVHPRPVLIAESYRSGTVLLRFRAYVFGTWHEIDMNLGEYDKSQLLLLLTAVQGEGIKGGIKEHA